MLLNSVSVDKYFFHDDIKLVVGILSEIFFLPEINGLTVFSWSVQDPLTSDQIHRLMY